MMIHPGMMGMMGGMMGMNMNQKVMVLRQRRQTQCTYSYPARPFPTHVDGRLLPFISKATFEKLINAMNQEFERETDSDRKCLGRWSWCTLMTLLLGFVGLIVGSTSVVWWPRDEGYSYYNSYYGQYDYYYTTYSTTTSVMPYLMPMFSIIGLVIALVVVGAQSSKSRNKVIATESKLLQKFAGDFSRSCAEGVTCRAILQQPVPCCQNRRHAMISPEGYLIFDLPQAVVPVPVPVAGPNMGMPGQNFQQPNQPLYSQQQQMQQPPAYPQSQGKGASASPPTYDPMAAVVKANPSLAGSDTVGGGQQQFQYCGKCGKQAPLGTNFCPKCGSHL